MEREVDTEWQGRVEKYILPTFFEKKIHMVEWNNDRRVRNEEEYLDEVKINKQPYLLFTSTVGWLPRGVKPEPNQLLEYFDEYEPGVFSFSPTQIVGLSGDTAQFELMLGALRLEEISAEIGEAASRSGLAEKFILLG